MRLLFIFFSLIIFLLPVAFGQTSNGQVSSLIAAENYFTSIVKEKGIKKAFLTISDEETVVFRLDPVKALRYFDKQKTDERQLIREPALAKISRSGDWGFTTGPYKYNSEVNPVYGEYVSIWKTNSNGVWKLAIDLNIIHQKPIADQKLQFTDPKDYKFFKQRSESRQKEREVIILTSDNLFSKTLEKYNNLAYNVFLADDARLIFPDHEPIIGKNNITDFLRVKELEIKTTPREADRAFGSDLAYTYGSAEITKSGKITSYNYLRIWEVQDGFKWNVILEVYTEKEPHKTNF
ncbi:MAG: nuclear transport factor 2 family protein [Flavobacterium sp.]|nr:nuclear transport factor 2 family protein [Pedobacter sp.]